jgi:hypothetical protein
MGLRIFELCQLCIMRFSYIRSEEKDAILPTNLSLLILYLTEVKKQINGIFEGCQAIYW